MRLFISIDFPGPVLDEIETWFPGIKGWKKVSKNQLHLTLVFLGECSEKEKEEIHATLSGIKFSPFSLSIHGLGAFPNESYPKIAWAGISGNNELMNLQEEISERMKNYIKKKETHLYIPHITLARKKSGKAVSPAVKKTLQEKTTTLNADINSFQLKQSILKSSGSEHHILYRYRATENQ